MYYYCSSNGRMHLWGWQNFKEAIMGRIIEHSVKGHTVKYIIYQVESEIDNKIIEEYDVICRKLDENEITEVLKRRKERKGEI